jgi:hypothetical protein
MGEYRRRETQILFEIELLLQRRGLSKFVFDEDGEVFRDRDGTAVLSRHYVDRDTLFGSPT